MKQCVRAYVCREQDSGLADVGGCVWRVFMCVWRVYLHACMWVHTCVLFVRKHVQVSNSPEPCPAPVVPAAVQRMPSFSGNPFASTGHSGTVCWTVGITEVAIVSPRLHMSFSHL